jgi:hypothetical protein
MESSFVSTLSTGFIPETLQTLVQNSDERPLKSAPPVE